jgi:hypothetical protein
VELVFDGVFACTTFGRGVQWFNAEDAEGEEETEESGRREKEERNMDGQDEQDEDGVALLEPEAEAPGPVTRGHSLQTPCLHEGTCALQAQHTFVRGHLNERIHIHRPVAAALGSNGVGR